jgi:hypothetical protein
MTDDLDLFHLDDLLSPEDMALRGRIRDWVTTRFNPEVNRCWNEA